jgi:hypothetical protein
MGAGARLDFLPFEQNQRIGNIDPEIADRGHDLAVTEQDLLRRAKSAAITTSKIHLGR